MKEATGYMQEAGASTGTGITGTTTGFISQKYCECNICPHCGRPKRSINITPYTPPFPYLPHRTPSIIRNIRTPLNDRYIDC